MLEMLTDMLNTEDMDKKNEKLRKRAAHKLRNRQSAKRSRETRKEYIAVLEAKEARLSQEIIDLQTACTELEADNIFRGSLFYNL